MVWGHFVPEITFILYLSDTIKEYVETEEIARKAAKTYPDTFSFLNGPDTYPTVMALKEAKSAKWHYARGDVIKGWKLTPQGIKFAKDVERRAKKKNKI